MVQRVLNSTVSVTQEELLGISQGVRNVFKTLTTGKRVPVSLLDEMLDPDESGELPAEEVHEAGTAPHEVFHAHCAPASVLAAAERLPIRLIRAKVADQVNVDCLLDQGAVICIIRQDVWAKLSLQMDVNKTIWLEAADSGKSETLGLVNNLRFNIAGIDVELQVHVVRVAPFEVLLGRPFFAATECETKDFANGDQHITITDPNDSQVRRKVATKFKRYFQEETGFQESRN